MTDLETSQARAKHMKTLYEQEKAAHARLVEAVEAYLEYDSIYSQKAADPTCHSGVLEVYRNTRDKLREHMRDIIEGG